jgi:TonB-linked SusC/RagA family outer membrane protein
MKRILFILICFSTFAALANAQTRRVTGKVTLAEDGEAAQGVSVIAVGTTSGTITDANGSFSVNIPSKATQLSFSFLGYERSTVNLTGKSAYNVVLKSSNTTLDEVVVVAGGIQRTKREQGYTATKITSDELTASKPTSIAAGLTAKVPGLQVNAISSGVNPNFRLVLRGNRSLTGNNTALIVVDNAVVSSSVLTNLNPEDIESIQVLNGAAGATLYGSEASNGVLLVTTKRGESGKPKIRISNTTTLEQVNFLPKLQKKFGQGSTADAQVFDPIENQQFGPAFDGSSRKLGYALENGDQQYTTYDAKSDREDFWETGVQNQTDLSISLGNDKYTSYISGQYLKSTGTTPGDKYNRISLRLNNTNKILPNLDLQYNANYIENNYDVTNATGDIYSELLETPANIPVKDYKDWKNNKWANPEGWYNPWYGNPYWLADNNRKDAKNSYLTGKVELKWSPFPWLYLLNRASLSNRYYTEKSYEAKYTYSEYASTVQGKKNRTGSVSDEQYNTSRFNHDFLIGLNKAVKDFSLNLILGWSYTDNKSKDTKESVTGLVIPGLYNVNNRTGALTGSEENKHYRNYGLWSDFVLGYNNYLFLHLTGRNDWTSLLAKKNRSYFYPSADLSFIATDAIDALKDNSVLDYLKIRGAVSKTGNVNIDPYALYPTFDSTTGLSSGTFFTKNKTLVSDNLKPEITKGYEFGTEFRLFNGKVDAQFNFYHTSTTDQAIYASVAPSSGYSDYLINTGEVTNDGIESALRITPIKNKDWEVSVGANYTHNKNLVKSLHPTLKKFGISGSSVIFAEEGQEVNQIIVSDYARDDQGRVIVDPNTGYPSKAADTKRIGNTTPKHRLGIDLRVRWKDFTLSTLFEYRGGFYAAAIELGSELDFSGASARSAYYNRERFVIPNSSYLDASTGKYVKNTNITVADGGSGFWTSGAYNRGIYSNYVYKADYWKWREIALTYQVPKSFLKKIPAVNAATISVQGRNLFLWTTKANEYTDPDYSANDNNAIGVSTLDQTPPSRYFGGTISLTF